MESGRQSQRPATMEPEPREPWDGDGLTREPLPPDPRSPLSSWAWPQSTNMRVLLGVLALLLVVTVVGTSVLVIRDLRLQAAGTSPAARATATATATVVRGTSTPTPALDPKGNGWTQLAQVPDPGDLTFSASSPQRGYLCGLDQDGYGVTTDGGQTWAFGTSPAANENCSIQISPTNPLDVALNSVVGSCAVPCPPFDAHYSTDGGKTWKAAPIPPNTFMVGGALWSGTYLYVWSGADSDNTQPSFLKVSANGGPFTSIDLHPLLPYAQNVSITGAVASGTKLYLTITYTGCQCQTIVASGDGGKTWAQVKNTTPLPGVGNASIQLVYIVGNTLYGQPTDSRGQLTSLVMRSTDEGATWTQVSFPPLPDGQTLSPEGPGSWLPISDGTIFVASHLGVAYLRAGAWTIIPFWSYPPDTIAVSLGGNGQPQRIWGLISPQASAHGIYWHALP